MARETCPVHTCNTRHERSALLAHIKAEHQSTDTLRFPVKCPNAGCRAESMTSVAAIAEHVRTCLAGKSAAQRATATSEHPATKRLLRRTEANA